MIGETLRVGDTVVLNIPDENWQWGYRPVKKQKGTRTKVLGFGEIAYSRVQNFGRGPGIFTNHAWVKLEGVKDFVSTCFIDLTNKRTEAKRAKEWRDNGCGRDQKPLRPLPEMKFWEGDIVTVDWGEYRHWDGEVVVQSINYDYLGQKRTDGSPMPEYNVTPATGGGGYVAVNESQMKLVRHGNVWKYFNGQKPKFNSLGEEAGFFSMLGHTDEVRNPKTKLFSWTKDEILQAVKTGIVDGFSVDHGLFGTLTELQHRAKRFRDRELGERVRQATIKGFNL